MSVSKFAIQVMTGLLAAAALFAGRSGLADEAVPLPPTLVSGCEYDYPPFCSVTPDGEASGFSVELLRAALHAMGHDVTFRVGPWTEIKGSLERGEVQVLPLVGRTPEREPLFDFTFPYISLHGAIVVRAGTQGIEDLRDLKGKRVAVMGGDNMEEFLRREDRGLIIETTATYKQALEELAAGRHDAVAIQRLVAVRLLREMSLPNLSIINRPLAEFRQEFCFAVKEGDKDNLALLNEGLALVTADGTYTRLHAKWFAALELPNRRIVIGGDRDYPPFEFLDAQGKPAGYNVELTKAVAEAAGIDVEIRLGRWDDIRDALIKGDIDAVEGMAYLPERDVAFDFSPPHTANHYVVVTRKKGGVDAQSFNDLATRDVVVQNGDVAHDMALKAGLKVTALDSVEDALESVAEGHHDCAVVARRCALYFVEKRGWKNLDIATRPLFSADYCFAVPNGHRALLAKLSEGIESIHLSGEYQRIQKKWMGVDDTLDMALVLRYTTWVVAPLLTLLMVVAIWSWTLRKQVARRTADLQTSEYRFRSLVEGAPDSIFVQTDQRFAYVNAAACRFFGASSPADLLGQPVLERFTEDTREIVRERMRTLNEERRPVSENEEECLRLDGGVALGEFSGVPLTFEGKNGALVFARDIAERKRAQEALRDSEARYRELVQNANSAILRWRHDGTITFFNEFAAEFFGYTPDEVVGQHVGLLLPDTESTGRDLSGLVADIVAYPERYVNNINENVCKDGRRVWMTWTNTPLHDLQGKVVEILTVGSDITERRRVEEALRLSEEKFAKAFATNPSAISLTRLEDGMILDVNESWEAISGFRREDVLGRSARELSIWPSPESVAKFVRELRDHGSLQGWEQELFRRSGETYLAQVSAQLLTVQGEKLILTAFLDITERKRAELALRESENRLGAALAAANDGLWDWNLQTGQVYFSPQYYLMLGYAPDEFLASYDAWISLLHPDDRLRSERVLQEHIARKGQGFSVEIRMRTRAGGWKWVLSRGQVVEIDADGNAVRLAGTHTDIDDRKKAEDERERLQAQLVQAQKMESVGRLAGGIAHDFNNMLGVILGQVEMALLYPETPASLHDALGEIRGAATRSADLTRQLLAFARKQAAVPRLLNLNDTVDNMLKMLHRLIGENIELSWYPDDELWTVRVDPSQVDQILANLCVNARDAIAGTGRVTLETRNVSLDDVFCAKHSGVLSGDYVVLSVSDSGIGMDKATLDRLFEPFFTTKELGKGTGLGLATVYGIIKQNGGFIDVYSEPGRGSVFRIYLPRYLAAAEMVGADSPLGSNVGGEETILLVEDEPGVLRMAAMMLQNLGYTVLSASTPAAAIELVQSHAGDIDLLVTDIIMPGMNGWELSEALRAIHPGLERLFMSGYSANVIAHLGDLQGGVHFIEKPFSMQNLAAKMREALAGEQGDRAAD